MCWASQLAFHKTILSAIRSELVENISHVQQSSLAAQWKDAIPTVQSYITQIRYTLPHNIVILSTSLAVRHKMFITSGGGGGAGGGGSDGGFPRNV
jgi:hypothetical protein